MKSTSAIAIAAAAAGLGYQAAALPSDTSSTTQYYLKTTIENFVPAFTDLNPDVDEAVAEFYISAILNTEGEGVFFGTENQYDTIFTPAVYANVDGVLVNFPIYNSDLGALAGIEDTIDVSNAGNVSYSATVKPSKSTPYFPPRTEPYEIILNLQTLGLVPTLFTANTTLLYPPPPSSSKA